MVPPPVALELGMALLSKVSSISTCSRYQVKRGGGSPPVVVQVALTVSPSLNGPSELVIELKDHDFGKDESLGSCSFDLRGVMSGGEVQQVWTDLVGVKTGKVLVSIQFTGSGYNDAPEENIDITMEETNTTPGDQSGLRQRNVAS